ncbi:MAG: acyl-CoA reductase [Leeuwenhoekiella sp.]
MELNQRITAFTKLGSFLAQFINKNASKDSELPINTIWNNSLAEQLKLVQSHNAWFTENHLYMALKSWSNSLTTESLSNWVDQYSIPINVSPKNVAIIMAGNLPLVGFHDFLSVLITGHKAVIKLSADDKLLLPFLAKILINIQPDFEDYISFTTERLPTFDAVIATGSNNTARYFEYYFKTKPHIIRKNRNAVAVLDGEETLEDLEALSYDIFNYFGMGCRSVSKLFIPKDYDFELFFKAMYLQRDYINHNKYANNYDYNKAVYLMSLFKLLDNEFILLKEDEAYSSPIAVVFYEYYVNKDELQQKLNNDKDQIQCIVANNFSQNEIKFGQSQHPKLYDYADGVDTVAFLLKI